MSDLPKSRRSAKPSPPPAEFESGTGRDITSQKDVGWSLGSWKVDGHSSILRLAPLTDAVTQHDGVTLVVEKPSRLGKVHHGKIIYSTFGVSRPRPMTGFPRAASLHLCLASEYHTYLRTEIMVSWSS